MMDRTLDFGRILGNGSLKGEEIDATIELAFLMAKADGDASFDELESFRALVKHLRPGTNMTELLDSLDERLDAAESIEERARACVAKLTRPEAREAAYKAVYTIAVYDLETNEEERDLDDLLVEILELDARVDDLEREVNEAL